MSALFRAAVLMKDAVLSRFLPRSVPTFVWTSAIFMELERSCQRPLAPSALDAPVRFRSEEIPGRPQAEGYWSEDRRQSPHESRRGRRRWQQKASYQEWRTRDSWHHAD